MKTNKSIIYIVDDNTYNLQILSKKLKSEFNCKIRLYSNAYDCKKALEREAPDIVLSDYNLCNGSKKMNGDWLLSTVKKHHPNTPVVLYSSINNINLATYLMRNGAEDFVQADGKFFEKIIKAVKNQFAILKTKKQSKRTKLFILLMVIILPIVYFLLNYADYEWPFYFSISFLAFSGIVVFLFGTRMKYHLYGK
ncbi:MAG: response regulator [Flavobacteriales bacterium]